MPVVFSATDREWDMILEISNWIPFYKFGEDGRLAMSQQTYEPLISPDRKIFCANYDADNLYQKTGDPNRTGYTAEVVEWFFHNELKHFEKFKDYPWCPEIVDIQDKKIFFKWQGYTCNELIHHQQLDQLLPDWKKQLTKIMTDCHKTGTYKLTMYPHCHYIQDGILKTFDMYGCVDIDRPLIPRFVMDGIVHETARFRLDETDKTDTEYNLEKMFKRSLSTHVKWAGNDMSWIHKEIFGADND